MAEIIPRPENVARLIYFLRGEKVMLDSELAELYGVTTKALNQAVKRNQSRFPADFMFRLTAEEWGHLGSRSVTSRPGVPSQELGNSSRSVRSSDSNRSHIVTGSQKHRDPRSLPSAFTEQGVAMRQPGGFEAISRWSSEAIPPAAMEEILAHPGGVREVNLLRTYHRCPQRT